MLASSLSGDSFEEQIARCTREHYRHLWACSEMVPEKQRSRDSSEADSFLPHLEVMGGAARQDQVSETQKWAETTWRRRRRAP